MKKKFTLIILILITRNMYLQAMDDIYIPTYEFEAERLSRIISTWPHQTAHRINLSTKEGMLIASMLLLIPHDPFKCPILGEIRMPPKNYPNALQETGLLLESSLEFLRTQGSSCVFMHKSIYEKINEIIDCPYVKKDDIFRIHFCNYKLNC